MIISFINRNATSTNVFRIPKLMIYTFPIYPLLIYLWKYIFLPIVFTEEYPTSGFSGTRVALINKKALSLANLCSLFFFYTILGSHFWLSSDCAPKSLSYRLPKKSL